MVKNNIFNLHFLTEERVFYSNESQPPTYQNLILLGSNMTSQLTLESKLGSRSFFKNYGLKNCDYKPFQEVFTFYQAMLPNGSMTYQSRSKLCQKCYLCKFFTTSLVNNKVILL